MSGHDPSVDELQVRVNRLSGRTFDLACQLVDGKLVGEEATREARVLLDAGRAMVPSVKALAQSNPEDAARLQSMLREALIEAQFVFEGGNAPVRSDRLSAHLAAHAK